jgi:hypothetical protein
VPTGQDPDAPKAVAKAPKSAKPDLALACLEEPERIAYEVIISDESLAPIVPRPAACARDLCAIGPGVDVAMEIRKAGAWLRSHPEQRKSLGAAYLGRWITRAQESARHRPTLAAQAQRLRAVPPPRDDGAPPATPAEQRAVDELRSKGRPTDEELMAPMVIPEHLRGAAS